jgi:glycosyltransferase involved in cell wall biosynthesis
MQKFSELLLQSTTQHDQHDFFEKYPLPIINKWISNKKIKKWAAYVDKYLIFPKTLKNILQSGKQQFDITHIIDHSNAPYLKIVKRYSSTKRLITCHDLIAIRSALGDLSNSPKISHTGKKLQNWILNSLPSSEYYVCDSEETKKDLNRLIPTSIDISKVIHLGTETEKNQPASSRDHKTELPFNPSQVRYLLHVGSAAWYKNRKAVFRAFRYAKQVSNPDSDLKLVLVGPYPQPHELDSELGNWLNKNKLNIHVFSNIPSNLLNTLYLNAEFLLFPSFIEGFAWPPLEAASRGCSVITTKTGAIYDLLGDNVKYVDADIQESINRAVTEVLETRSKKTVKVSLPTNQECRENYHQLYHQLLKTSR